MVTTRHTRAMTRRTANAAAPNWFTVGIGRGAPLTVTSGPSMPFVSSEGKMRWPPISAGNTAIPLPLSAHSPVGPVCP